jgi:primosomal protein N'
MKTIIKKGQIPTFRYVYKTTCKDCGTVFTCESEDFKDALDNKGFAYGNEVRCPLCGRWIDYRHFKKEETRI